MTKIAIIGGGAAGMMAAATLLESKTKLEIHLFEKNSSLGVKVKISGGGRCNVTTGINHVPTLLKKYIRGAQFLKPSLAAFPPQKVRDWFEAHDLKLKEEADHRVFPVSDKGEDVITVFDKLFKDPRIHLHFSEGITDVKFDQSFKLISKKASYSFDKLIITSGGNAYAKTGSTGDGYTFAKGLGNSVTKLGPSLNSFIVQEDWCKSLAGISFANAALIADTTDGKKRAQGPLVLTHFGISGPAVFALAAEVAFEQISINNPLKIKFLPDADLKFDSFDQEFRLLLQNNGAKLLHNIFSYFFALRFAEKIIEQSGINNKKAAEITKLERHQLVKLITQGLPLTLLARRPGDEFVTAGGVELSEINPKTMQSKIIPNLYFAGEILNIDGLTGGFNLQAAWATGRMAGINIIKTFES